MIYQIVSPVYASIQGDSFKEAVKNYVKFNRNLDITNLIIKDQADHQWEARLRYYMQNEKNKVGIDVYPYTNVSIPVVAPVVAAAPVITGPVVSAPNSRYFATANNVFIRR
jgi:hypothetical protein